MAPVPPITEGDASCVQASQGGNIFGNAIRSYATGEGFVCRFTGPGTIFVQTRSLMKLAQQMWPYIPDSKRPKPPGQGGGGGISLE